MHDDNSLEINSHIKKLNDPRNGKNLRHQLLDLIIIAICAVIGGADNWVEIAMFGEAKLDWFRTFLELPHGIPSHDTFGRVFSMINPHEFQSCFISWIQAAKLNVNNEIISIDGKTVRRSHDRSSGKKAIHVVSAWANNNGIVLGQVKVNDKTNEIKAIPELLSLLEIKNSTITIDAMGCQRKIARKIIEKEANYVLALKGNQGLLYEDIKLFFKGALEINFKKIKHDYYKTLEKDHGRIEKREYWITSEIDWQEEKDNWAGFQSAGMVKSTRTENEITSIEYRYYITSLACDAKIFGNAVRSHWGIENSLHWVLDVTFKEDQNRVRKDNAPENQVVLRHIALNLLKQEKSSKKSIKCKRLDAGWRNEYLSKILFNS